ncbi:hypothetical protein [Sediminicola luteus]|uniref:Uncharacterized protein n=1 Tax=Sediminicola luteus TaxID=319238 RepID=A0A2A4GEE6_9FLAO|nr:hypothetical protein [Sediminicola luteus]PCE66378.1 hypothetical protein B7P33_03525 [Sediminicola luteus]
MEKKVCPACGFYSLEAHHFCDNCNYPFSGTDKERSVHIARFIDAKGVVADAEDSILRSQKIIFAVAAVNTVFMVIGAVNGGMDVLGFGLTLIVTVTILLCGVFIKKQPVFFTLVPLILIVATYIINFTISPESIFRGIIFKLIIIGSLGYSIYLVKQAERFKNQFQIEQ